MRLEGKVALITGAGSGQGREAAVLFATEGAQVVVTDVNEEGLAETIRWYGQNETWLDRIESGAYREGGGS